LALNKVVMEIDIEDRDLEVVARADQLARALASVVSNAIQYSGITGPIVVLNVKTGDEDSIMVAGNGPRLPPEELEEVFKPNYRPGFDGRRETDGVGFGLAIVRICMEACEAPVNCRNRLPKDLLVEIHFTPAEA
jgi:two-component system, OmpR family, sensor histidine kinase CpxA